MKSSLLFVSTLLFSITSLSLCTWTPTHCKTGTLCYNKGTASCRNLGCEADQQPGGHITIYNNGEITQHGQYDIAKSPSENCRAAAGH